MGTNLAELVGAARKRRVVYLGACVFTGNSSFPLAAWTSVCARRREFDGRSGPKERALGCTHIRSRLQLCQVLDGIVISCGSLINDVDDRFKV